MSQRRKSILINDSCNLGWSLVECRQKCMEEFEERIEQEYIWIQEVLVEIKKKFNSPEVQLCPKTPSASRKQNARSKKQNSYNEEDQQTRPRRNTRRGKGNQRGKEDDLDNTASSVASIDNEADANNSARSIRSTRSNKAGSVKSDMRTTRSQKVKEDVSGPEPIMKMIAKEVSFKPDRTSPDSDCEEPDQINESSVIVIDTTSDSDDEKPPAKRSKTPTHDESHPPMSEDEEESTGKHQSLCDSLKEGNSTKQGQGSKHSLSESRSDRLKGAVGTPQASKPNRNCNRESPRTIPNFAVLNVKGKAQAYEHFVTKTSCEADETATPRCKTNLSVKDKQASCRSPYTAVKPKATGTQGSNKVISVKGGGRLSLSKRRSSIIRHKLRQEVLRVKAVNNLNKQDKNQMNESLKSSPEKSPPRQTTPRNARGHNKGYTSATKSSEAKRVKSEESPYRSKAVSKSKLRLQKSQQSIEISSGEDCRSPLPVRSTRSKMRKNQAPPPTLDVTLEEDEDSCESDDRVDSSTPIQRVTRSKIRKNRPAPPSLPTPPSEEDGSSTPTISSEERSTKKGHRSVGRLRQQLSPSGAYLSGSGGSVKRNRALREDSDESSPPKRQCVEDTNWTSTPSHKTGPRIVKPVRGGVFSGKPPVNLNSTARSFLQRNTPKKKTTKEVQEQKQKFLAQKEKEAASRLLKREESLLRKREEARKVREQRQKAVAQRREEKEKETKLGMAKKFESTKDTTLKLIEDKRKETEREKQKLRDKKMFEAEMRRKQEEEQRLQKLKEQAMEQKRLEEMQQRKREFEEKERQRRLAEQKHMEEERRLELERERQREIERQRQLKEEQRKKEESLRKEREDRERREKLEREKIERERQEERERNKRMEYEKQKEFERQKLLQQQKEQQMQHKTKNEEKQVLAMIQKHNSSLHQNSSLNVSKNTSHNTSGLVKQTGMKLNTSYTIPKPAMVKPQREENPDSYEITPVKPKVYKYSDENYNIDNIKSDDSTDDEDAPKKKLPSWATGGLLRATIINQTYQPPNIDEIFSVIEPPDLNLMFAKKRARFNKRTSSAIWESPILKPSGAIPS